MQRVLVREVQVATGKAERRACRVLGFSRTTTVTGAGVIRGSGCSCVEKDGS